MRLWIIVLLLLISETENYVLANNVQVSNIDVFSIDRANKIIYIQFDLSGENAWHTTGGAQNWDANWVFVKYRTGMGNWQHATLSTTQADYHSPTEAQIDPVADGKGVYIYAADANAGNIPTYNYQHIVLAWEYGTDGFDEANTTDLEVRVFAIEMVYIPQSNFWIGDGSSTGTFHNSSNDAVQISTNLEVVYCDDTNYDDNQLESVGIVVDGDDGIDTNGDGTVDNFNFPTGYKAFYCMKYEISQQQYVDFLNNLTSTEASNRDNVTNSVRNNVTAASNYPNITTSTPYVAMNWLDWFDVTAYLDWAALRPMTELEFEKTARGPNAPIASENVWGTDTEINTRYTLVNTNAVNEAVSNPSGTVGNINKNNTVPDSPNGPMRCGIFAVNNTSNSKIFAGASFYGVMELSGNLWESIVTLGDPEGRNFDGSNGDGQLVNSEADNTNWPRDKSSQAALGAGFKGGSYRNSNFQISDRGYAAYGYFTQDDNQGGRGVRSVD